MTLFFHHPDCLKHDTGQHPESATRVRNVMTALQQGPLWGQLAHCHVHPAAHETIALAHDDDYIRQIESFVEQGGGRIEADTVTSAGSDRAARLAVGAAVAAVDAVLGRQMPARLPKADLGSNPPAATDTGPSGDSGPSGGVETNANTDTNANIETDGEDTPRNAFCLMRPPGHHALHAAPMGFCLFNSVAVAAEHATRVAGVERVLIVDWDVHHGNGTQDRFWSNGQVGFFSAHRHPFYPGSGLASETGTGAGLGATVNVPLAFGIDRHDYRSTVTGEIERFADRFRPQLVLVSAGFDSHSLDPVGNLGLESEDFVELTNCVTQVADTHCDGRLVSLLEGGYNTDVLPECVSIHIRELLAASTKTGRTQ